MQEAVHIADEPATAQARADGQHNNNGDTISQGSMSSTNSRASSFKAHGFGSLIKNEEDENQLEKFFQAERHYMVLTNAGKPVFSM
jgi:hypothetical protein